jgi:hypothetical protein
VELLLSRPAKDWLSDGSEVGWCLHARSFCGPPGSEITCCGQGADDKVYGSAWHAGTQQPLRHAPMDKPGWPLREGDQIARRMFRVAVGKQDFECENKTLITFALLCTCVAWYGGCQGETH